MVLEPGKILEGKVTGIMPFGAFVTLEDGKTTGLVHISEVALDYVENIKDHVSMNDVVKVMVLSIGEGSKVSLSIKKALKQEMKKSPKPQFRRPAEIVWDRDNDASAMSFEDKMQRFKQDSEDKMQHFKRMNEGRSRNRRS